MTSEDTIRELLAGGPFAREDAPYGLVRLAGPDGGEFLQRVCSQDVLALAPSEFRPSAFLDAKGRVVATFLVGADDGAFWLELPREQIPTVLELLERYRFAERMEFAEFGEGPCRERIGRAEAGERSRFAVDASGALRTVAVRRGIRFEREHGAGAETSLAGAPLPEDLAECLRMTAGFVRVGVETEPSTLALEAGLDDHCSTTKGCYTGQEIVARIHTYGHVNRRLCLLRLGAGERIGEPVALHEPDDDLPVGRVMHAVPVPGRPLRIGLGFLPDDFQSAGTKLKLAGNGEVEVLEAF